jgi:Zc3h12a-like Ribonuclease NYN domain/S1 RNA binding domain
MPNDPAPNRRIVVDGSNLATEGRSLPSLAQLEEAIQAFMEEFPGFRNADVIVVVDASFGHRIDESERAAFEEAVAHGEMVTPPAGAIGRGDAFILRIAEKAGALVLSNDSFQEFHAERPWLFESGRLIGGKPIPGVGWIFTPRTPVRGAVSRATTSRAKKAAVAGDDATSTSSQGGRAGAGASKAGRSTKKSGGRRRGKAAEAAADAEPDESTDEALIGSTGSDDGGGDGDAAGDEAPKKARSGVKKAGARTKKAAAVDKVGAADKAGAPTKAAAKTTKAAKGAKAATKTAAKAVAKTAKAAKAAKGAAKASATTATTAKAAKRTASKEGAVAESTVEQGPDEANGPTGTGRRPGRRAKKSAARAEMAQMGAGDEVPLPALNEPMTFLTFVANHPIGSTFKGTVASYTSHGAHIDVDGMKAHVPLSLLGRPAPGKARDVLSKGETRDFVLVSLDAPRRRAEVSLPAFAPGS